MDGTQQDLSGCHGRTYRWPLVCKKELRHVHDMLLKVREGSLTEQTNVVFRY